MTLEAVGPETEPTGNPDISAPIRAAARRMQIAQSSYPDPSASGQLTTLFAEYAPLGYYLPWETLGYIELLSTYNPDYSQAVDNIRSLANSGHELFVDARSKAKAQKIKDLLEDKARTIQSQHGGIDGLIDKLLDQAAVYGAMCGEWVLNQELTDVVDFVDINPKLIRFFWDKKANKWAPHQEVSRKQAEEARKKGQEVKNDKYVRLNDMTFHYFAFDAAPSSPYGTPPFLASLANIAIQRDMINNMAQIVKKIGLLGIIDLAIKQLPPLPGESDAEYEGRASQYLDDYVTVIEDMVRDGGMAHYDDVEVTTYNITGNAAGATNIFKQNEELIFSGLKSMPSVQGRSYCLEPNTRILMADGSSSKIKDVQVGDMLQGFDEYVPSGIGRQYRHWHSSKVEKVWKTTRKSVKIHFSDGRYVTCSVEHPFLMQTDSSGKVSRDLVHRSDSNSRKSAAIKAANARWRTEGEPEELKNGWKVAGEIRVGEYIKSVKEPLDIDYSSLAYKRGYVAGAIAGDGHFKWVPGQVTARGRPEAKGYGGGVGVCIDDREIVDRIMEYLFSILPEDLVPLIATKEPNRNPKASSFIGTKQMIGMQFRRIEQIKILHEAMFEDCESNEFKAGWLSGIYDTDGCGGCLVKGKRAKKPGVSFSQNQGVVYEQIVEYLNDLGFAATRKSRGIALKGGLLEAWRFTSTVRPALDRKVVDLEDYAVRITDPVRVDKVEFLGDMDFIDLTTSTSTLVANGLLTHNSTTETYAGVAYDIIIRNTLKYQKAVKRMIESGYWLMATLWGEEPKSIKIQFNDNKSLARLENAQAQNLEIKNAALLWLGGLIDQLGFSQRLGISSPKKEYDDLPPDLLQILGAKQASQQTSDYTPTAGGDTNPEG